MKNTKLVQMLLSPQTLEKIEDIRNKLDCMSRTEVVRRCIADIHKREFPDYITVAKAKNSVSPVDKAMAKAEADEIREKAKVERETKKLEAICLLLDEGEITSDPETGAAVCRYPLFTGVQGGKVEKDWTTHPISMMNVEMIHLQYHDILG